MAALPSLSPPKKSSAERLENLFQYLPSYIDEALVRHNPIDTTSYEPSEAKLSTDPILTALAQLAAFRTDTERAFISLIDDRHQIVVAEATRSISLTDEKQHASGDGLCIGSTILDLTSGICASTMDAFIGTYSQTPYIDDGNVWADRSRYIINDLSLTSKFRSRPYVTQFPLMRYYAEVPITSPSGFVIGSVAVVDPSPRKSLSETHYRALKEISSALMRHLMLLRAEKSHQRTARKLASLDHFVSRGEAAVENIRPPPLTQAHRESLDRVPLSQSSLPPEEGVAGAEASINPHEAYQVLKADAREVLHPESVRKTTGNVTEASKSARSSSKGDSSQRSTSSTSISNLPTELQGIFAAAAKSIMNSMDLDFVSFYDTHSSKSQTETSPLQGSEIRVSDSRDLKVLASVSSYRVPDPVEALPKEILLEVHELFPQGCRMNFVPDHLTSTQRSRVPSANPNDPQAQRTVRELRLKQAILAHQPDLRAAMFMPFWSESRQSWIATAFSGTFAPRRVIEKDDLSYLALFRSCILTTVTKMDLIRHDRAKIDFVSSISHELRSPIHGILGNTEMVYESNMNASQLECVRAIEQCSRTLLDTVDHILDYAKISASGTSSTTHTEEASEGKSEQSQQLGNGQVFQLESTIEDTLVAAIAGYRHMWKSKSSQDQRNDIGYGLAVHGVPSPWSGDKSQEQYVAVCFDAISICGWHVVSHLNVWRRIILNLVGNALKYTPNGLISITLELRERTVSHSINAAQSLEAVLTVKDTGKGMASNFLQHHLFRPFQQENGLNPGTGLGLSIVKKLVEDLGGAIFVRSETGTGSEFRVIMPVTKAERSDTPKQHLKLEGEPRFFGFDGPQQLLMEGSSRANSQRTKALKGIVMECLKVVYNIEKPGKHGQDGPAALRIYTSSQYLKDQSSPTAMPEFEHIPTLILSDTIDDQYDRTKTGSAMEEYVAQPISSARIAAAIDRLLVKLSTRRQPSPIQADTSAEQESNPRREASAPAISNAEKSLPAGTGPVTTSEEKPLYSSLGQPHDRATSTERHSNTSNESHAQPSISSEPPAVPQIHLDTHKPTFLLVDDSKVNLSLLKRQVTRFGCNHMSASDGQQAVDLFRVAPCEFAGIFMDLSMPIMDGFQASRIIREIERAKYGDRRTVIIALTGLSDANAQQQALQCGVDIFMTKPVSMKQIKGLMENDLGVVPSSPRKDEASGKREEAV